MTPLLRQAGSAAGEAVLGAVVAAVVAGVGLVAFSTVEWPAFNASNVLRALTTVGQVVALGMLVAAIWLIRVKKWPWVAKVLAWGGLSGFVTVTLGMPLAATKLYLFGMSVDQEFRTQYLTRLTDSAALHDMNYIDLPPFYPAGWFWFGGRFANLTGMAGWEAFKPYAIIALAVAAVVAYVLWSNLIRADWAVAVAAATTAVTLAYGAPEAYGAVLVLLFAPALVLAWGALHRPAALTARTVLAGAGETHEDSETRTAGGWGAVIGVGLFLGLSAAFYTLYFVVAVFSVCLMALIAAALMLRERRRALRTQRHRDAAARSTAGGQTGDAATPSAVVPGAWAELWPILVRLITIGAVAGVLALTVWMPFLVKFLRGEASFAGGSAFHYLPETGSELALPMFQFSLVGAFCLIGTIWLVLRVGSSRRAQALAIGVVAVYLWSLLSMTATAAGTTLLSFRLEPILYSLLAAAGAFGFVEGARAVYQVLNEPERMRPVVAAVAVLGAVAFSQEIPHVLDAEITTAYTDTDGNGVRADKRPPSAVSHYAKIDAALRDQTGRPRDASVVLTADTSFLAIYPYYGFQALTSHYANPLADFPGRTAEIKRWAGLKTPEELIQALQRCPWRAPDAFLFRNAGDQYTLRLSEDVYPNDPNVKRFTVAFPKALFEDARFQVTDIGPFTLVVRR
ncbi:galactan 5-O-arabinofuranosyltransferase [Nocardia huaxiensis]|uniref:Galactan 5-O-arabinofuranosyltransferase n=2 Tax=Nocardia huaxiensis TaxID=2755382 RepID=A0A7D6ZHZ4_9NOCA|nr:galactan 5-O-arabinofuranosyltransferase [Nocardia huaxiensis]QLY34058.1 galactan 5-O-arabinofuranosyltransferase [Nocardia huaxiensis]UFT00194.1 galactan 5-O-arabinofuranosyltransferase [Nocardia huaxiensis]